jgi:hypothetical protein
LRPSLDIANNLVTRFQTSILHFLFFFFIDRVGDPTPEQVGQLNEEMERIIGNVYDADLKDKNVVCDDLYHAIFKIIQ